MAESKNGRESALPSRSGAHEVRESNYPLATQSTTLDVRQFLEVESTRPGLPTEYPIHIRESLNTGAQGFWRKRAGCTAMFFGHIESTTRITFLVANLVKLSLNLQQKSRNGWTLLSAMLASS